MGIVDADRQRVPGLEPVSVTRAFMLVSGLAHTIGRALENGHDLGEAAEEIKAVLRDALIVRAPATPRR